MGKRGKKPMNVKERLLGHIQIAENIDECWIWKCRRDRDGYGISKVDGKSARVHRIMYELYYDVKLTPNQLVLHKCNNGHLSCCNPEHLKVGTHKENAMDRDLAGRTRKGSLHGNAKLTEEQAKKIKELFLYGYKAKEISEYMGIPTSTVYNLKYGAWKHV